MFHPPRSLTLVLLAGALTIALAFASTGRALPDEPRGRQNDSELLAAVTASLKGSYRAYLEIPRTYWDPGEAIRTRTVVWPLSGADWAAGRLKGNWERMLTALAKFPKKEVAYAVLVAVYDADGKNVVWRDERR